MTATLKTVFSVIFNTFAVLTMVEKRYNSDTG